MEPSSYCEEYRELFFEDLDENEDTKNQFWANQMNVSQNDIHGPINEKSLMQSKNEELNERTFTFVDDIQDGCDCHLVLPLCKFSWF